jgi:hypothetical protein
MSLKERIAFFVLTTPWVPYDYFPKSWKAVIFDWHTRTQDNEENL